ncbi:MAG: hypothetical protein HY223_00155 [Thaumarchaeota archaeon]|nr:hypothetical protein [Nitrososphaerota archaeon]
MTKIHNKKLLFAAILPTIATAVIIAYLLASPTQQASAAQTPPPQVTRLGYDVETVDSYIAKGGKSIAKVEIPVKQVDVIRGSTAEVDLHLKHIAASASPFASVNVKVLPLKGYTWYPASLASSTTFEQRVQAAETGNLIPGSVDLGSLVTFSETNSLAIGAGNEHIVKMFITIPKNLPDDIVGQGAFINIPIEVTDDSGNPDTVFVQSGGIKFQVVG